MGSPPDDAEFRRAVAGVAPLAESRRVELRPDPPPPLPRQSERDERAALAESIAGPVSLDDAIDSGEELSFLRRCMARRLRCVRIVHGKGLGSHNREPVLKGMLRKWLSLRDEVLAFCQAPAPQGGAGAVLVLLRNAR